MNLFDDYAGWTDTTAKYPVTAPSGYCSEPSYLALGIADEMGELVVTGLDENRLKEAGDVLWYAARYATKVLRVNFSAAVEDARFLVLDDKHFHITEQTGIICGVEKKRIRDSASWNDLIRGDKERAAYSALVKVITYVIDMLHEGGYTIEQAIERNMGKLNARLQSGTIHGDGDNR